MSRRKPQPLYHPPYAEQARRSPGTWIRVRTYESAPAAHFIATTIRQGTHPAYRAPGHYLAEVRHAGVARYALWISYQPPEQP